VLRNRPLFLPSGATEAAESTAKAGKKNLIFVRSATATRNVWPGRGLQGPQWQVGWNGEGYNEWSSGFCAQKKKGRLAADPFLLLATNNWQLTTHFSPHPPSDT
jgi:hypothetical protein